ncbi:NAD(P)H-dependent oxidoreductase [Lachnospiraceae bacterium ZAX-1]
MKILAIIGSLRKESLNRQLAELAKAAVGNRTEFEVLDFSQVPFFNQDIEYPVPASVAKVRQKVKQADAIWFFTPEYNHFFPGVLKNLLDWLSRPVSKDEPQVLFGKATAISGITPGMSGTGLAQDHLITLLSFLNMRIMNTPRLTIQNAMTQVEDGKLTLTASAEYLQKQSDAFISFVKGVV